MPSKKQRSKLNSKKKKLMTKPLKQPKEPNYPPKEPNYPPIPCFYKYYKDCPYNDLYLEGLTELCFDINDVYCGRIEKSIDVLPTTTIMITKELECECCVGFSPNCVNLIKDRIKLYTELIFEYKEFITDGDYKICMDGFKDAMDVINELEENKLIVDKNEAQQFIKNLGFLVYIYYNTIYGKTFDSTSIEEKKEIFRTFMVDDEKIPWGSSDRISV